ncbi:hypothetical protein JEZ13_01715 [bacterium]|nr:hypothetical protein [bacterium]
MKKIKNIGAVDLRFADEETLKNISQISNTGIVIYSNRVKSLISDIAITNTGMVEEIPEDYQLEVGNLEINKIMLETIATPLKSVVVGVLSIADDVTPELLQDKIAGIYNIGVVNAPKDLIGHLKSKIIKNVGVIREISHDRISIQGSKEITNSYLNSLKDGVTLEIMGSIAMLDDLDIDLFSKKIKEISLMGSASIREKYQTLFESIAKVQGSLRVVPDNCKILRSLTQLDSIQVRRMNKENIFSHGSIIFTEDVTEADIQAGMGKILKCKRILANKNIIDTLIKIIDSDIPITSYKGKLLINSGEKKFTQLELQYAKEAYFIINKGVLSFEDKIDPDMFYEKIDILENYGQIYAPDSLYGLVELKTSINKGELINSSTQAEKEGQDPDSDTISNMGMLKL